MLGCCISAFSFILFSSIFGMPISGTHTVIGALIGCGLAAVGIHGIGWHALIKVVLSWFVSPILAMTLCGVLFIIICCLTLGGWVTSIKLRLVCLTFVSGLSVAFMTLMCINISFSNPNTKIFYSLIGAFVFGVLACRLILVHTSLKLQSSSQMTKC